MNHSDSVASGLTDVVHESQQAFRAMLATLARPGLVQCIGPELPSVPLGGALARLLLSLSDDETAVWWQCAHANLSQWLRFHTGATQAQMPDGASFAVLTDPTQMPLLADFASGSVASPESSCTLFIELPSLDGGPTLPWHGPGIETVRCVSLQGLPEDFWPQWQANHAAFPQGVDVVFTSGQYALGLPRTTQVRWLNGA